MYEASVAYLLFFSWCLTFTDSFSFLLPCMDFRMPLFGRDKYFASRIFETGLELLAHKVEFVDIFNLHQQSQQSVFLPSPAFGLLTKGFLF